MHTVSKKCICRLSKNEGSDVISTQKVVGILVANLYFSVMNTCRMSFLDMVTIAIREADEAYHFLEEELREGGRLENTGIRVVDLEVGVIRCYYDQGTSYGLSISFLSRYCETALINVVEGSLAYVDEWGYADVVRLGSYERMVDEIIRVRGLVFAELDARHSSSS